MWQEKSNIGTKAAQSIIGTKLPCKVKLLSDYVTVYTGAGFEYVSIGSVSDVDKPEIAEVKEGKESRLWGSLKSGSGWIPLDQVEVIQNDF